MLRAVSTFAKTTANESLEYAEFLSEYKYQLFYLSYRFLEDLHLLAVQSWRKASHYECCSERVYPAIILERFDPVAQVRHALRPCSGP